MKKIILTISLIFFAASLIAQKTQLIYKSGHQNPATMSSISADGKYLVTVDKSEIAIIWDAQTMRQLRQMYGIIAAGFTDNNTMVVVNSHFIMADLGLQANETNAYPLPAKITNRREEQNHMALFAKEGIFIYDNKIYQRNKGLLGFLEYNNKPVEGPIDYNPATKQFVAAVDSLVCVYDNISAKPKLVIKTNFSKDDPWKSTPMRNTGEIDFAIFSADGKEVYIFSKYQIAIANAASGVVKKYIYSDAITVYAKAGADNKSLYLVDNRGILSKKVLNDGPGSWEAQVNNASIKSAETHYMFLNKEALYYTGGKKTIAVSTKDGALLKEFSGASEDYLVKEKVYRNEDLFIQSAKNYFLKWDLLSGKLAKVYPLKGGMFLSSSGEKIFSGVLDLSLIDTSGNLLSVYTRQYRMNKKDSIQASVSADENYLVQTYYSPALPNLPRNGHNVMEVFRVKLGERLFEMKGASAAAFANTKNIIAAISYEDKQALIAFYSIPDGATLFNFYIPFSGEILFSPNDKYVAIRNLNESCIINLQTKVVNVLTNPTNDFGSAITSHAFDSEDKVYAMGTAGGTVSVNNLVTGETFSVKQNVEKSPVLGLSFAKKSKYLFTNSNSNYVRLWNLESKLSLAILYPNNETGDWAVITPEGRYDASPGAQESMYYVKGLNTYPLSRLSEKFYTPNLLPRLLNGEEFANVDIDIDNIRPKPRAKILYTETKRNLENEDNKPSYTNTSGTAEITVHATAPEDKVDEIRLFHNGKAVNLATRGLFVTDADGADSKKYTINLLPGQNTFRAIALNSQRTESEPDEIMVTYTKDGSAPEPVKPDNKGNVSVDEIDRNATLHIVVVGINAYKNKINPLTYALPDATAFKEELEKDAKSMINNVKSYLITDDAASKAGIVAAFDNIKKSAKPQDVFVFYYAGHGYIHPSNKEFYLVSSDVADGGESLLKNGVSAKELQTFAVDIPAQKQLFIMDACQSAGAFEKMLQHDGEQQKALAVVSRSTGTHWMAASGSTETAKEFGELGHGVFTYSLLEALKGKAVSNKMITVNGLKNYLQTIVPELVKKYGGNSQYPASYGFGNDFPVEIVK